MISMSQLISRRLRPALCALDPSADTPRPATSYGAARLGLAPIDLDAPSLPPLRLALPTLPAASPPIALTILSPQRELKDAPTHRRASFKLPAELHDALRRRAQATGQFQYQLVADALKKYLDESPGAGL